MNGIAKWLADVGLAHHATAFVDNDIDLDVLPHLTEADLKELGLSLGDRKRALAAIQRLATAPVSDDPPVPAPAEPPPAAPAGARRQVTVLFADLSGFTELTARLDAEEVHAMLQRYFAAVDDAVRAFGGSIDKHIGDAVMAVFGAPVAHSDDPERAVRAALDIHRRLADFDPPLVSHIGIASGQVVAGRTGSDSFEEYTVTGATVNLASRLQDRARGGETLISAAVQRAIGGRADAEAEGRVEVKGFEEPVEVYRLIGLAEASGRSAATPFVGRRRERRQLSAILAEVLEDGSGQLVLVRGEPGIGKTRLVDAFVEEADGAGFACHTGLVLDFGAGKGREAIPALTRSLLGIPVGSGKPVRRAAVERGLASGLLDGDTLIHVNELLDLPQPADLRPLYEAMDNETRRHGRARAVSALVAAAGRVGPVLIRVEDIHWADAELLPQLAAVAARLPETAAVMVMTSRLEGDPVDAGWRAMARDCPLTTIDLGPLRADDAAALADRYAAASADMVRACIERAAGNPLFLDQLLQSATESGERGVPGSVQSIVQSRLDNLAPADREALQAAAVFGQRFPADGVAHLIGVDGYDCAGLLAHHLVRPEGDQFLFVHALVREGVYEGLLRDRRRDLHRRAAHWYEGSDGVLHAHHLEATGDPGAAAAYLAAADEQMAAFQYERALRLANAGAGLDAVGSVLFDLNCRRGDLLRLMSDSESSLTAFSAALALADTPEHECTARIGLAEGMRILDRFDDAFAELDRAGALAAQLRPPGHAAQIAHMRGNLLFPLGRTEECLAAHEEALRLSREAGGDRLEVQALGGLGDANYASGRLRSAWRYFEACVERARAGDFAAITVANEPMLGWTTVLNGDFVNGMAMSVSSRASAAQVGNDRAEIIALNSVSGVHFDQGRIDEAESTASEIVRLADRLGAGRFSAYGHNMLAQVALVRGERAAGRGHIAMAKNVSEGPAFSFGGPWILAVSARLEEDADVARAELERGEAMLAAGALAHNHFFFRREVLQYCLDIGDLDGVERQARQFEAYLGPETTGWTDYFIGRARALAAVAAGHADDELRASLKQWRAYATAQGLLLSLPAVDHALARIS
jgi:class 3 adenylate cyclase/tetratricopeptide (TPR) repeat protein